MLRTDRSIYDDRSWDVFEDNADDQKAISAYDGDELPTDVPIAQSSADVTEANIFGILVDRDFGSDDVQSSGPAPELSLSEKDEDSEDTDPPASVTEADSPEPIIFDEDANQSFPVDTDADEQFGSADQSDDLGIPELPEPGPDETDYPQPALPAIGTLPEPHHEAELDADPPYDFAFELDDNDDMGNG